MVFEEAKLGGAFVVELDRRSDERGFFARSFCEREFAAHGLPVRFPQCNISHNLVLGTLRGMHYQASPHAEAKLVRCVTGAIYDVIVDLRPASATFLQWIGVALSADNGRALFVPEGFAHGFLTLTDAADVFYQMSAFHVPDAARGLRWNDAAIGIEWPSLPVVISSRDAGYPDFDRSELEG